MSKLISKKILITWFVGLSVLLLYLFIALPFGEIHKLKNHYYTIKIKGDDVSYVLTDRRPKSWTTLDQISKKAAHSIVVSEDWAFYEHEGVDLNQIKETFIDSFVYGKDWRGASTITQQLIKNLFLTNERTLSRKFKELILALYIEKVLDKNKILEIYLNVIEYGKNLYGITDATKHYFKTKPKYLSAREGAFLAMLLPSPVRYSQSFRDKKLTPFATRIINSVLTKLKIAKYISKDQLFAEKQTKFSWEQRKEVSTALDSQEDSSNLNLDYDSDQDYFEYMGQI